jgi:N-methylhydantoinase B
VLDASGTIDATRTKTHRDELLAQRRRWPANKALAAKPAGELTRIGPLGDRLEVVKDVAGARWTRCTCGAVLAKGEDAWREYAGKHVADPAAMGIPLKVHELLELREYACPSCGRLQSVDVCRKGSAEPDDIRLTLS